MKIVILGAGAVGSTLADLLSAENDLTIVDNDPIKLHKEYLPQDDIKFKNESYIEYIFRIWNYFIFPLKKHEGASGTN